MTELELLGMLPLMIPIGLILFFIVLRWELRNEEGKK